jgi:ribonuclease HII
MAKQGRDEELEKLTEDWLRNNDPDYQKRNKGYTSENNMDRKARKEIPISNLNKQERSKLEEEYYSNTKNN